MTPAPAWRPPNRGTGSPPPQRRESWSPSVTFSAWRSCPDSTISAPPRKSLARRRPPSLAEGSRCTGGSGRSERRAVYPSYVFPRRRGQHNLLIEQLRLEHEDCGGLQSSNIVEKFDRTDHHTGNQGHCGPEPFGQTARVPLRDRSPSRLPPSQPGTLVGLPSRDPPQRAIRTTARPPAAARGLARELCAFDGIPRGQPHRDAAIRLVQMVDDIPHAQAGAFLGIPYPLGLANGARVTAWLHRAGRAPDCFQALSRIADRLTASPRVDYHFRREHLDISHWQACPLACRWRVLPRVSAAPHA